LAGEHEAVFESAVAFEQLAERRIGILPHDGFALINDLADTA